MRPSACVQSTLHTASMQNLDLSQSSVCCATAQTLQPLLLAAAPPCHVQPLTWCFSLYVSCLRVSRERLIDCTRGHFSSCAGAIGNPVEEQKLSHYYGVPLGLPILACVSALRGEPCFAP